jgi:hypothetical protein
MVRIYKRIQLCELIEEKIVHQTNRFQCIPALLILRVTLLSTLAVFVPIEELVGVVFPLVPRSTPALPAAFLILLDVTARRPCGELTGV